MVSFDQTQDAQPVSSLVRFLGVSVLLNRLLKLLPTIDIFAQAQVCLGDQERSSPGSPPSGLSRRYASNFWIDG